MGGVIHTSISRFGWPRCESTTPCRLSRTREALARLTETLRASGFPVEVLGSEQELDRALWRKLAVNAAINPLTALHGVLNGEVLARADLADLARQLCEEVAVVAAASGRRLTAQEAWAAVTEAAERTAGNRSSMLQDMKGGRPLELQAINGAVVEEAEVTALPCACAIVGGYVCETGEAAPACPRRRAGWATKCR